MLDLILDLAYPAKVECFVSLVNRNVVRINLSGHNLLPNTLEFNYIDIYSMERSETTFN